MSSVHNPSTSSEKVIIEDGKDRISELPDAILVHILSFLRTDSVIAKSLISPRWRNLWASVPVLDFNERAHWEYRDPNGPGALGVPYGFMDFVNKVLLRHDLSSISKFRLYSVRRLDLYQLNVWITHLVNHLIQEIDVKILSHGRCVCLPQSLCTSKTLVVLRLGDRLKIELPSSVWFPSLKILEISLLHPENNMTQKLLSSCSVLEELTVDAFLYKTGNMVLNVAIPTLKRLTIEVKGDDDFEYHDSNIMLDTPSLENLSLEDGYLVYYSVKNMASLVKANVHIGQWLSSYETKELDIRLHAIMRGLATVKSLSLSNDVFVVSLLLLFSNSL